VRLQCKGTLAGAAVSASGPDVFTSRAIVVLPPVPGHPNVRFVTATGDTAQHAVSATNATVYRYLASLRSARLLQPALASAATSGPVLPVALCCLLGAAAFALGAVAATVRRLPIG
jgi:hypothetical protein